jgi:hypothetical protein
MTDPTGDPIGALHRTVSASDVVVRSPHGVIFLPLFRDHTVDQVPFLRDFAK